MSVASDRSEDRYLSAATEQALNDFVSVADSLVAGLPVRFY